MLRNDSAANSRSSQQHILATFPMFPLRVTVQPLPFPTLRVYRIPKAMRRCGVPCESMVRRLRGSARIRDLNGIENVLGSQQHPVVHNCAKIVTLSGGEQGLGADRWDRDRPKATMWQRTDLCRIGRKAPKCTVSRYLTTTSQLRVMAARTLTSKIRMTSLNPPTIQTHPIGILRHAVL
jgi:hypothetical protein